MEKDIVDFLKTFQKYRCMQKRLQKQREKPADKRDVKSTAALLANINSTLKSMDVQVQELLDCITGAPTPPADKTSKQLVN